MTLELKPLTVLLGPNSSGKSSFSHPLAALSHCQTLYEGRRDAMLTPRTAKEASDWPVDLGRYRDLTTSGSKDKVFIAVQTSVGWVEMGFGLTPASSDLLLLSHIALPHNLDVTPGNLSGSVEINQGPALHIPAGKSTSEVGVGTSADIPETRFVLERINEQQWRHGDQDAIVGLNGLLPISVLHASGSEIKLNGRAIAETNHLLENLRYLRASRQRPSRGFLRLSGEQKKSVGYSGEWTASVLLAQGGEEGKYLAPPVQVSFDRSEVRWPESTTTLQDATGAWLSHLQLANSIRVDESERYGKDYVDMRVTLNHGGGERDITEVGYAISQIMPVIVGSLLQPKDSLLIVDLPEAHLHPRPQGALADLFCALVKGGRSVIVETHSEMFFQRLRLRAAMEPELAEQIAVYFIDAHQTDGNCSVPRRVGLGLEDEINWPSGFLTEAIDAEIQIRSARQVPSKHG